MARRSDTPQGRALMTLRGCIEAAEFFHDVVHPVPEEEVVKFVLAYGGSWHATREEVLAVLNGSVRSLVLPDGAW